MSEILITGEVTNLGYLGIESFEDAVFELQKLEASAMDSLKSIRSEQKGLIRKRFKQGQIVHLVSEDASYGDGAVKKLSQAVGMSDSTLYEARSFYLLSEFSRSFTSLNQWLDTTEERKGHVSWSYCRSLAAKRLDPKNPDKAKIQQEKEKKNLEKRVERLEQDAEDYMKRAETMPEGEAEEFRGVASKALEVAEDTRRQIEEITDEKPGRIVDDKFRALVKQHRCAVCQKHPTDPAHLPVSGMGGMATKVWDYFCIPLCREHHNEFDENRRVFYQRFDINPWRICCFLLVEFFTGIRLSEN